MACPVVAVWSTVLVPTTGAWLATSSTKLCEAAPPAFLAVTVTSYWPSSVAPDPVSVVPCAEAS